MSKNKVYATWSGPYVVVEALGNLVFQIKDLITNLEFPCHAARLHFYSDKCLNVTQELLDYIIAAQQGFEVDRILAHGYDEDTQQYMFLVCWFGFEAEADSWEPAQAIIQDAPKAVENYVRSRRCPAVEHQAILELLKEGSVVHSRR